MKKLKLDELGRLNLEGFKQAEKVPISLLLDNVRSLHNVGSAFRTADCFRIEKIFLTGFTGTPPHREIHKTALGATESVEWSHEDDPINVVDELDRQGVKIVAVEQTTHSIPLGQFKIEPGTRYCLVFGNEINGVSDDILERIDTAIEVPQSGTKHSLNISVCIGIVLWEFYKKLHDPVLQAGKK